MQFTLEVGQRFSVYSDVYYVYTLWCPLDKAVRYVGTSCSPGCRLMSHMADGRRRNKQMDSVHGKRSHWIGSLIAEGFVPVMEIIGVFDSFESAVEFEAGYFSDHKASLLNTTKPTAVIGNRVSSTANASPLPNLSEVG